MINEIHNIDNAELLKKIPDLSIDLILEDMPYNTTDADFEYAIDFSTFWKERERVIKGNGAIILFAQQPFACDIIQSNRKLFRYDLIWDKIGVAGFLNANKMPLRRHELILVFYKKLPTYNPQKTSGLPYSKKRNFKKVDVYQKFNPMTHNNSGDRFPTSIIEMARPGIYETNGDRSKNAIHPTQKPVDLFRWIVRTYTNPGETVFDGFVGSGTTAAACIAEGRNFICCEWMEKYFLTAKKRIDDAKLQKEFTLDL